MGDVLEYRGGKRVKLPPTREQMKEFRAGYRIIMGVMVAEVLNNLRASRLDRLVGNDPLSAGGWLYLTSLCVIAALAILWCVRVWKYRETWRRRCCDALLVVVILLMAVGTFMLNWAEIPFHLAFAWNRPALERAVAEVRADPAKGKVKRYIGIWPVEGIAIKGDVAYVSVEGTEGIEQEPFLRWDARGSPPSAEESVYGIEALGGGWYWAGE